MGTWGPGAFDNDDALDLLGMLEGYDEAQRRQAVEYVFRRAREHPEDLSEFPRPGEVVAAAALVAAGLEPGEAIRAEIIERGYEAALLLLRHSGRAPPANLPRHSIQGWLPSCCLPSTRGAASRR